MNALGDHHTDPSTLGDLLNPSAYHGDIDTRGRDLAALLDSFEKMLLIRRVEEVIADNVRDGIIRCPCHLAIGQEACAVGVSLALRRGDRSFGAHRSHGHFLALGGSPRALFAEVLGRDTGVSRGMGGSMHLVDRDHGLYGTVPIVGATIPIAVGAALASTLAGDESVAVSFFGDGATEEGAFHESLNLAANLTAPVLFVCENNLFSSHLHIDLRQPRSSTSRFADAQGIAWRRVDGNDVLAVMDAAASLVELARDGSGPVFLELLTYRWRGHVGWRDDDDVGVARKSDLPEWRLRDPIGRLKSGLLSGQSVVAADLEAIESRVRANVTSAWGEALLDPFPAAKSLLDRVFATDTWRRPELSA
jgi:TPP-dependent pyruvate/acetoin dehydrogenase alpha subunit